MTTEATESPEATEAPNTPSRKAEQKRGYQEASRQFELLRATWPKAFPAKAHEVRPLAGEAKQALIDTFGWNPIYARAVLMVWKVQASYCKAVLYYPTRIKLDGSPSGEEVSDVARTAAKRRLEEIAARRAKNAEEAEKNRLRSAANANAQSQAPEPAPALIPETVIPDEKPEPAAPPEPPKPRKLIVASSAAMQAALKLRLAAGGTMTTEVLRTVPAPTSSGRRERQAR